MKPKTKGTMKTIKVYREGYDYICNKERGEVVMPYTVKRDDIRRYLKNWFGEDVFTQYSVFLCR